MKELGVDERALMGWVSLAILEIIYIIIVEGSNMTILSSLYIKIRRHTLYLLNKLIPLKSLTPCKHFLAINFILKIFQIVIL
jgi:hypothetical protein